MTAEQDITIFQINRFLLTPYHSLFKTVSFKYLDSSKTCVLKLFSDATQNCFIWSWRIVGITAVEKSTESVLCSNCCLVIFLSLATVCCFRQTWLWSDHFWKGLRLFYIIPVSIRSFHVFILFYCSLYWNGSQPTIPVLFSAVHTCMELRLISFLAFYTTFFIFLLWNTVIVKTRRGALPSRCFRLFALFRT